MMDNNRSPLFCLKNPVNALQKQHDLRIKNRNAFRLRYRHKINRRKHEWDYLHYMLARKAKLHSANNKIEDKTNIHTLFHVNPTHSKNHEDDSALAHAVAMLQKDS